MLVNAVQRSERGRLVLLGLLVVVFIPRVCRRGSWGSYPVTIVHVFQHLFKYIDVLYIIQEVLMFVKIRSVNF